MTEAMALFYCSAGLTITLSTMAISFTAVHVIECHTPISSTRRYFLGVVAVGVGCIGLGLLGHGLGLLGELAGL